MPDRCIDASQFFKEISGQFLLGGLDLEVYLDYLDGLEGDD